ncbi:MAG: hypothetical protein R2771_16170, partial [Saprospiraceae bacterium]
FFIVFILFVQISYSQTESVYEAFEFEDYKPVWQHVVIDSTIIGKFKEINPYTDDSIFYNGFSHFISIADYCVHPVYFDSSIILTEMMNGFADKCKGAFIQCIDMQTGEVKWTNLYDLRTESREEYPERAFINDAGQYELIGHRRDGRYPNSQDGWINSLLSVRKYNKETGELEDRVMISEDDSLAMKMIPPYFSGFSAVLKSYLYPYGNGYQYIYQFANKYKNYYLDAESHIIDTAYIDYDYDLYSVFRKTYLTDDDKFKKLDYISNRYYYWDQPDTLKLFYTVYDRDFNLEYEKSIAEEIKHCYSYNFSYIDKDYFIIAGEDRDPHQSYDTTLNITYAMFDKNADLIEEITLYNEDGSPIKYPYCCQNYGYVVKSRDEPGMIWAYFQQAMRNHESTLDFSNRMGMAIIK